MLLRSLLNIKLFVVTGNYCLGYHHNSFGGFLKGKLGITKINYFHYRKTSHFTKSKSTDEVLHMLSKQGAINLLEIDVAGHEWDILSTVLDNGLLEVQICN